MMNDRLGCCTCSTAGHMIQTWTAQAHNEVTVPDAAILAAYEAVGGYIPGNDSTDNGARITDLLNYFRDVGIGGHKISAWAEVNITQQRIQQAVYLFDAVDVGLELPISCQSQIGLDKTWDIVDYNVTGDAAPGTWGGHSVPVVKYDPTGLWCVTWGQLQKMSWQWFMYYTDECYAAISTDDKIFPVSVDQLVTNLRQVGT